MKIIKNIGLLIIIFLIIQMLIFLQCAVPVYATDGDSFFSDITDKVKDWRENGEHQSSSMGIGIEAMQPIRAISQFVFWCACILLIPIGIVTALKAFNGTSAEEKAEGRKKLLNFCIGSVIVLGSIKIWEVMLIFFSEVG